MATKWKNKTVAKLITGLLILGLSLLIFAFSAFHNYMFGTFEKTDDFMSSYYNFRHYLALLKLNSPFNTDVKKLLVTDSDIHEFRYRYGNLEKQLANVRGQYKDVIAKAEENNDKDVVSYYKKVQKSKLKAIQKNFESDRHVIKQIRDERAKKMDEYDQSLAEERQQFNKLTKVFHYDFVNKRTGERMTNVRAADGQGTKVKTHFKKKFTAVSAYQYSGNENKIINRVLKLSADNYQGKIFVADNAPLNQLTGYKHYEFGKTTGFILLLLGLIMIATALFISVKRSIRSLADIEPVHQWYARIPIELRLIFFAVESYIFLCVLEMIKSQNYFGSYYFGVIGGIGFSGGFFSIMIGIIVAVSTLLYQLQWLAEMFRDPVKRRICWQNSIFMQTGIIFHEFLLAPFIVLKLFAAGTALFLLGLIAVGLSIQNEFALAMVVLIFAALPFMWFVLHRAAQLNRVVKQAEIVAAGGDLVEFPIQGKGMLGRLSHTMNEMQRGVRSSRNAQLKSERLKTELITNVSHDLRTPLTSIITYNDLLRKSDVSDEERQDYLAIIDRKAKRLKRLIDDLFDASKMASGAIELHKTKVNLNELLTQALAEYDEAMQQSKLNFRIKTPNEAVPVYVDGQKLWRVFDNLIGNILKYSLEGTRVYITIEIKNDEATATFKNVTKYELGDNVDELFERFKRGDASRHTEGSGLGLAIAKSIIDLHGGLFDLDLDGDLFKVMIRLPIA
ncbi:HAMP domain-containing histidine kinase [Sporolactobacillus shoreicorticis]|uniref:histidine kinase n=1 Tax=Sporolactobacillus shoreicorticis TaxID=1923877 RepID=A0ABW5S1Y4_9BACL|nr:HAMP domain-containing sensor histidine kinase [Sporolactobacillus shoreicorticis]MCO7127989.1 HAMP domain-containing histidine kinase [Sporolactobacillus shoreicorticis]